MNNPSHSLTRYIFLGMAVGLAVGYFFPDVAVELRPLSTIFIRLIKSLIAPLIFSTLVVGIAGHGDLRQVGRMGIKSLVYFEIITTLALVVGLVAVNVVRPGVGVNLHVAEGAAEIISKEQTLGEVRRAYRAAEYRRRRRRRVRCCRSLCLPFSSVSDSQRSPTDKGNDRRDL